jgi:hypothetical protein
MGLWRCPRCGTVVTLEPRFGQIVGVYDLCTEGTDARAGRGPTRMEPVAQALEGTSDVRQPELVNSPA